MRLKIIFLLIGFGGLLTDSDAWTEEPNFGTTIPIAFAKPFALPKPPRLPKADETSFDSSMASYGNPSLISLITIKDPKPHGALSTIPLGKIATLQVTWADPRYFHTESWIERSLKDLLSNPNESNYTFHAWQYLDGEPLLVATVQYASGKQGAWWIWRSPNIAWAFEDENGKWWWGQWDQYAVNGKKAPLLPILSLKKEPETSLTLDHALDILKHNEEISGAPPSDTMDFLNVLWAHDPSVIAFFRDALKMRGFAALQDLSLSTRSIWDDSFVDPILKVVEASAKIKTAGQSEATSFLFVFDRANILFHAHPSAWNDPTVAQRLSKAVLTAYPFMSDPATVSNVELLGCQEFSRAVDFLSETRDRSTISILRPYLKVKELDGGGFRGSRNTPIRVCDHVREAIHGLLDESREMFVCSGSSIKPVGYPDIWVKWDKKNIDLEQHLLNVHY